MPLRRWKGLRRPGFRLCPAVLPKLTSERKINVEARISPRSRKVRVLATLGPASASPEMISKLLFAGADAFRINMSHGGHEDKLPIIQVIRMLEKDFGCVMTILFDL